MRPDVLKGQSIECSAFLFFPDFEPNACPALSSDAVAKEIAARAERGMWDLLRVRELLEWMRNDVYSEVLVGRRFVNSGMQFAEMACGDPATTAVIVDLTVLRTPRGEWEKSPFIQINKDAYNKDKKFSPKITSPALELTNMQDGNICVRLQVPRGGTHPNGVGSELTFFFCSNLFFCYSWYRLQLIAIHCNRRGV